MRFRLEVDNVVVSDLVKEFQIAVKAGGRVDFMAIMYPPEVQVLDKNVRFYIEDKLIFEGYVNAANYNLQDGKKELRLYAVGLLSKT